MELSLPSEESDRQLEWLNKPFPKEAEALIQKGLRKRVFDQVLDLSTRKPVKLLEDLL
jgi:hypothetical protein